LLAAATGYAQDEEGFYGRVALGYLATTGNAENKTLSMSFDLGWNYAPWHHAMTGAIIKATTGDVTTAEAYSLDWQSGYDFTETSYAFGRAAWDEDKFSGYARQVRVVGGYGRRIIDMERHALNGEVGIGLRESDLRDGTSEDDTILRLSGNYLWTISETSEFSQTLAIESGSSNTFTEAVTKLTANIRGDLSVVLSYRIRKNSDVPVGTVKIDTFTAVALEYTF
jgi:putative salt-induced outer membrane protein